MVKADSYANIFLNGSDGSEIYGKFGGLGLTAPAQLEQLYVSSALVRRIIDIVPEVSLGAGFNIEGIDDEGAFWSRWDDMDLSDSVIDALAWARLYGGAAVVAIVKDGRALTSPVREGAELETVRVYDRQQVRVQTREENPRNARFGKPLTYRITPNGAATFYDVHYTRCHIIDGERVPNNLRRNNDGWGASVLTGDLIDAIDDYQNCERLATQLLRRKQQAVWKAKGLADLCDDSDGFGAARLRLAQVDNNSGVGQAIGIDAESEEYNVLNSDIGGIDTFLSQKFDRIVALSGIHEIILKGKNVGGVSASQNTALETFYGYVDRKRKADLLPLLEFLLPFIVIEQEWSVEFNPLSQVSDKDKSEILEKNVNSVAVLIAAGVMNTEEARDTLRTIATEVKLHDGDVNLPEQPAQEQLVEEVAINEE